MNVLILMECSGAMRLRFLAAGHDCRSVDIKPSEVDSTGHIVGDAFEVLSALSGWANLVIAHPVCTYLTGSAEWAYADPDFDRYPGVGYHQRVRPATLTGSARRSARESAIADALRIWNCGARRVAIENPVGVLSRHLGRAQVVQPWWFGDDASKATCWWTKGGLPPLVQTKTVAPRMVSGRPRWGNQTDSGQNRLPPGPGRAADRARTYPGMADAIVNQWGTACA